MQVFSGFEPEKWERMTLREVVACRRHVRRVLEAQHPEVTLP